MNRPIGTPVCDIAGVHHRRGLSLAYRSSGYAPVDRRSHLILAIFSLEVTQIPTAIFHLPVALFLQETLCCAVPPSHPLRVQASAIVTSELTACTPFSALDSILCT